ncbi:MAG: hypothetical protein DBX38_03870 [Eubacteriales Family XIII. Incertae Sedis bacterium]|nr:MAG: hypothetical protein DBX38_03870 [Clostridiales Family XIII bacterium]
MTTQENIIFITEIIGTIAFAASGAMIAIRKELDLFGIIMLGTITAVGGGILRDIIIGRIPPNTFVNPVYIATAALTSVLLFIIFYKAPSLLDSKHIGTFEKILNIFDAIGLGAFTVIGIDAGIDKGYGEYLFLLIFLGVTTGIGGSIMRDIMAGEIPYVLKKQIYACASIAGACLYVIFLQFSQSYLSMLISALLVVVVRMLASKFDWNLPAVRINSSSICSLHDDQTDQNGQNDQNH